MSARLKTGRARETNAAAANGNGVTVAQTPDAQRASAAQQVASRFPLRRKVKYQSLWVQKNTPKFSKSELEDALSFACRWLAERCMNRSDSLADGENPYRYPYTSWRGAAREYLAGQRRWRVFGPLWHTGQMAKALAMAHEITGQAEWLDAAKLAGEFILAHRISDPADPDCGLIFAYENSDPAVSATSCLLESLDGLLHLSAATGDAKYTQAVIDCLEWAERRMYLPDEALFLDDFNVSQRRAGTSPNTRLHEVPGRPLIDDGVYLKGYLAGGRESFRTIFYAVADRLLAEESPAGNWIAFPPCDQIAGAIHPRQAYWWGMPMIDAWQHSRQPRYLACAQRVAEWYAKAQRCDGGMFRFTTGNFQTTSFSQASSGIFCAARLWTRLIVLGQGDRYLEPLRRAIQYGLSVQFRHPSDPNLLGALIESIDPPDGGDALPYNVRDLASIFFVQALAGAMRHELLE